MKIGSNLLFYRKLAGLSQEEVATHIGVTRKAYGFWESDERQPKFEVLEDLANLFHTDISNFFKPADNSIVNMNEVLIDKIIDDLIEDGTITESTSLNDLDEESRTILLAALNKHMKSLARNKNM